MPIIGLLGSVRVIGVEPEERLRADREADGFEPFAAEDEHGDVDAGAGDGDFSCVDAIDRFATGERVGIVARARREVAEVPTKVRIGYLG